MSNRHTPGPWRAERRSILASGGPFGLRCIAETFSGPCKDVREADANGLLIAAAPELLAALVRLDRLHRGLDAWHEDAAADAWMAARTAIARATGEGR